MLHVSTHQEMDQAKLRLIHYTIVWLVSFREKGKLQNVLRITNEPSVHVRNRNRDKNLNWDKIKFKFCKIFLYDVFN